MKKILLIIFTIILILSINVLAVDIEIGMPAIDRTSSFGVYTLINKGITATGTGKITSVEIWAKTALVNCEVATFYVVSGDNLSTRDTYYIGNVTAGSKQTKTVDLDVQAGDYIGMYYTDGGMECSSSGGEGFWYLDGDGIPCTDTNFFLIADYIISLYGTGTTDVGWPHKWNTLTISKWNTQEFTKWNGLE